MHPERDPYPSVPDPPDDEMCPHCEVLPDEPHHPECPLCAVEADEDGGIPFDNLVLGYAITQVIGVWIAVLVLGVGGWL